MKYRLRDLAQIKYGKDHKKLKDGDISVYGTGGLMRKVNEYLYDGKSVLIPRKGSLNNVMYVTGKFWTVDTMFWTHVDDSKVIPKYLYYCLSKMDLESLNVGSAVPSLTTKILNEIILDIPPKEKQKEIIDRLAPIEEKVRLNNKINDNLTSLLDCIFNNFYQYANNELSTKFETIAEIGSSNRIFAKEYKNVGIPFLRGKEISLLSQGVMPTDTLFISSERYQELKNVPNERDILITSVGTIGNIYQVEKFRLPFYYKDGNVIRITPKKGFENYIYLWLNSKLGKEAIVASTIGSTQKALTISAIKKFELLIPNSHKLEKFNDVVGPIINLIQQNHKESEDLQEVKSTLLKRYF